MGRKRAVMVVGALTAAVAMLGQGVTQADPTSRTTSLTLAGQAASAVAEEAVECGITAPDNDQKEYGYYFEQRVYLRTGPAWVCGTDDFTPTPNNLVDYHCWARGDGTTWTYLRTATSKYGWVWDSYLQDGGSHVQCPAWLQPSVR
ncbi:hypothetical protein [Streptomyces sp. KR55]|uniref:hypothetical protein n=1 Tax=Streptomyces sp. KR55 TaxID=3457425 RepID=UPI003FD186BC